jgi:hypothetical protein
VHEKKLYGGTGGKGSRGGKGSTGKDELKRNAE